MDDEIPSDFSHRAIAVFLIATICLLFLGGLATILDIGVLSSAEQTERAQECSVHGLNSQAVTNSLGHVTAINCLPKKAK